MFEDGCTFVRLVLVGASSAISFSGSWTEASAVRVLRGFLTVTSCCGVDNDLPDPTPTFRDEEVTTSSDFRFLGGAPKGLRFLLLRLADSGCTATGDT